MATVAGNRWKSKCRRLHDGRISACIEFPLDRHILTERPVGTDALAWWGPPGPGAELRTSGRALPGTCSVRAALRAAVGSVRHRSLSSADIVFVVSSCLAEASRVEEHPDQATLRDRCET